MPGPGRATANERRRIVLHRLTTELPTQLQHQQEETSWCCLRLTYDQVEYFKAEDLEREKKFRIKNVTEEVDRDGAEKEKKLVVWFTNDERGLVLNKTNNRTLRGAFGDDMAGWTGKIIVVFPTMAEFRGKMVPALRVRIPPPKQASGNGQHRQQQPTPSGNGAAAARCADSRRRRSADPELEPDPVKPIRDEMDDEIPW